MWRLRESATLVLENETLILQAVAAMRSGIDGVKAMEIGVNQSGASDAADLALYSEFDSWEALQAYEAHPLHDELRRLIGPMRIERRVVNYETP
jgi:hypothetical protein